MMKNINNEHIGARIRAIRLARGMTMEEFGEYFGARKGVINNWEKGRNLPNKRRIKAIADMANISVQELLYGIKEKVMYGIEWWNGEIYEDADMGVFPVLFSTNLAAHNWLLENEYEENSIESYGYYKEEPTYDGDPFPDVKWAKIIEMEVVE